VVTRDEAIQRAGLAPNMHDAAFDRLCRIARVALSVDTVFFTIIEDDRQFFPSHVGLPEPYASKGETPISHSFCQHVVDRSEPLIIPDTATEPLVADNPSRLELSIGSYLGVPVRAAHGTVIGTLCSTLPTPRSWSKTDVEVLTDIAASIETELRLRAESDRLQARQTEDRLAQEYEEALHQISAVTNRLQTIQGISDELANRIGPAIGAALTSIAIVENDELHFTHAQTVSPQIAQAWTTAPVHSQIPMAAAVTAGLPIHLENESSFAAFPAFVEAAEQLGLQSFKAIPFGDEGLGLFGVLGIGWTEPTPAEDVPHVLGRIVELAQTSLARAWQFETEQNQARVLERVVLPTALPDTSIYKVAGVYIAPDASQRVGGDVYDVIIRADGAVGVMIADAVGHDLTATRAAARLRHAIGVLVMEGYSPAEVMGAVNRYISASPSKRLVTCVCLLFAADGSSVTVANAGHPQPVLKSSRGAAFIGPIGESLLGRGAVEYSETAFAIAEGDFVLCFTDGLIDRRDRAFIESEQWLLALVDAQPDHEPRRITDRLQDEIDGWVIDDDVAFLVVSRRTPEDHPEFRWARPAREINLKAVRTELTAWTIEAELDNADDLVLVASELVTNARDASGLDDDVIFFVERVPAAEQTSAARVRMQVSNRSEPFTAPSAMPEAESYRGRGLAISEAMTSSLEVVSQDGWIVATAIIDLAAALTSD